MKKITILLVALALCITASAEIFSIDYTASTNGATYTVGQPFKVTSASAYGASANITVARIHKGYTNSYTVASNAAASTISNWPAFVSGDTIVVTGTGTVELQGTR